MGYRRSKTPAIEWNKVTWYSRLGAIVFFIGVVPALSFYIGTQYELTVRVVSQSDNPVWERLGIEPISQ